MLLGIFLGRFWKRLGIAWMAPGELLKAVLDVSGVLGGSRERPGSMLIGFRQMFDTRVEPNSHPNWAKLGNHCENPNTEKVAHAAAGA